jgi:hypothetical protein
MFLNKFRLTVFLALLALLCSCASVDENISNKPKIRTLLGSDRGYSEEEWTVLKDFTVSELRIRLSKFNNPSLRCSSGEQLTLEIDGAINSDTSYAVEKIFLESEPCILKSGAKMYPTVFLNSNGGKLSDGFKIGRIFRKYKAFAFISNGQVCASSCAVAFLGASVRTMKGTGKLLFHAPYISGKFDFSVECINKDNSEFLQKYLNEMLNNNSKVVGNLYTRMFDYCSTSDGWTLDKNSAEFFGLTN